MACRTPATPAPLLRAAEAFGATGALFLKGTASPFNPKTLRASAGSLFRVPFLYGMDAAIALAALRENGWTSTPPFPAGRAPMRSPGGRRSRRALRAHHRQRRPRREPGMARRRARRVHPYRGVESLNAAMAAGILLYEARRQRSRPL